MPTKKTSRDGARRATAASDAKHAKVKERHASALRLRTQGLTYKQIADRLGYASKGAVCELISRELREIPAKAVGEYRDIKLAELEELRLAIWPRAMARDPQAISTAAGVIMDQCRIKGALAPTRTEVTGADGGPVATTSAPHEEIIARIARLAAAGGTGPTSPKPVGA